MELRAESLLTSDEKSVTCKHGAVIAILEQIADAVLSVAGCVKCFDFDVVADGESLAMFGGLGDFGTVFAADYGDRVGFELKRVDRIRMSVSLSELKTPMERKLTSSSLPPA